MTTEGLSAYELKRLETIRKNQEVLRALGIDEALAGMRSAAKPKPATKKQPAKTEATLPQRRSRRSGGLDPQQENEEDDGVLPTVHDPNDVQQMTQQEVSSWCSALREKALEGDWMDALTEEQRSRVHQASEAWLQPFTEFIARFGSATGGPPSKANVKSVLRQVMQLVSGAGLTTSHREGRFVEGRPITLGITAAQVDALRAEAQLWLPQKAAPADLVGVVVNGVTVQREPSPGPRDTSNGWFLNHPLMKVRLYCEHLDEVSATSLEVTMRRLTGDESWGKPPPASPPPLPPLPFSEDQVTEILKAHYEAHRDFETISATGVRKQLEAMLGLEKKALKQYQERLEELCLKLMTPIERAQGRPVGDAKRQKS